MFVPIHFHKENKYKPLLSNVATTLCGLLPGISVQAILHKTLHNQMPPDSFTRDGKERKVLTLGFKL